MTTTENHTHHNIPSDDLHATAEEARAALAIVLDCASRLHAQDQGGALLSCEEADRIFGDLSRAAEELRRCLEAMEPAQVTQ